MLRFFFVTFEKSVIAIERLLFKASSFIPLLIHFCESYDKCRSNEILKQRKISDLRGNPYEKKNHK